MTSLTKLKPRVVWGRDTRLPYNELVFLCPRCRRHEIGVRFHARNAGEIGGVRVWKGTVANEHAAIETLTISPMVKRPSSDRCGGWQGTIQNGAVA